MKRQKIPVFLAVAEQGSISSAAKVLHFSQPVVSSQLSQLEEQLGVPLVSRGRGMRAVRLTPEGKAFLPIAQRWMENELQVELFIQKYDRCSLRLAASNEGHDYIIPSIVQKMMRSDPGREISLRVVEQEAAVVGAADQEWDVLLTHEADPQIPFCTTVPLYRERRVIVCPRDTAYPDRCICTEELDPAFEVRCDGDVTNLIDRWHQESFPGKAEPYFQSIEQRDAVLSLSTRSTALKIQES